tara:strand:- start:273 stop:749 length:477 start_codon:yes stop_codon:yes gene_type:complete
MTNYLNEIATALMEAQKELVNGVVKNSKNPHFGSDYADLKAVLETSLEILPKYGLSVTQGSEWRDGVFLVTCKLMHTSGQMLSSEIMMPVKDRKGNVTPHTVGQAMTYGRRYLLTAMLGLGQKDDDGNEMSISKDDLPLNKSGKSYSKKKIQFDINEL